MQDPWLHNLESLEEISQNAEACAILLRMADMKRRGRMHTFIDELTHDPEVDDDTKGTLIELAQDDNFLRAIEDYVYKTAVIH